MTSDPVHFCLGVLGDDLGYFEAAAGEAVRLCFRPTWRKGIDIDVYVLDEVDVGDEEQAA